MNLEDTSKSVPRYDWERFYVEAVLETDRGKLKARVAAAEKAITARLHEISLNSGATPEEKLAIQDAMNGLHALRNDLDS